MEGIYSGAARSALSYLIAVIVTVITVASVQSAGAISPADFGLIEGDVFSAHRTVKDPDVYIVNEHGYKRLFVNPEIFNLYGHLGFESVKDVPASTRDMFPVSGLFRNCEVDDERVYGLDVINEDIANLRWVNTTGEKAVADDPGFFKKVFCINSAEQALYGIGPDFNSVNEVPDYTRTLLSASAALPDELVPEGLEGSIGAVEEITFQSFNNEDIGEGQGAVPVLGYSVVTTKDGDIQLMSAQLSFEEQGAGGSTDLKDYAESMAVTLGADTIAELDVASLTENAGIYSKRFVFSGESIIRASKTGFLRVRVTPKAMIDSTDLGQANNSWEITMEDLRFVDGSGTVTTETDLGDLNASRSFYFSSFQEASGVELNLKLATNNPPEGVIPVKDDEFTDNALLLSTKLSAKKSDITVNEMTIDIVASGGLGVNGDIADQTRRIKLLLNGQVVQQFKTTDCSSGTCDGSGGKGASASYVFDDIDFTIPEGASASVQVVADMKKLNNTTYFSTDSLRVYINNEETVAEDENGDDLSAADLTGSVEGEELSSVTSGPGATLIRAHAEVDSKASPDIGLFTIQFMVIAFEEDAHIQEDCSNGGDGISFGFTGSASVISCSFKSSSDEDTNGNYHVYQNIPPALDPSLFETFTLTVAIEGDDEFVSVFLNKFDWALTDTANPFYVHSIALDDFETDAVFLSSN